jgi:hypothetical protein
VGGDLRKQVEQLRALAEALRPPQADADYLRERFSAPEFDEHREQIVAALLSEHAAFRFRKQLPDDVDPAHPSSYLITWHDRSRPPLVIRLALARNWREHKNAGSGRESIEALAERASPYVDTLSPDAPAQSLPEALATSPAGRPERAWDDVLEPGPEAVPDAAPNPGEDDALPSPDVLEIQAEIGRLQRQIAENEAQQRRIDEQRAAARQRPETEPEPHYPRRHPLLDKQF